MFQNLVLHPQSDCEALTSIAAQIEKTDSIWTVRFRLQGAIDRIVLPAAEPPQRKNGLWRSTCCEIYIRIANEPGYFEVNLAPSTNWAIYRFERYREGMRDIEVCPPEINCTKTNDLFELTASLEAILPDEDCGRIGLSAVIKERNGNLSYWALAHASGEADFHNDISFAIEATAVNR